MAVLERGLKQRIVGALVLLALAVIFLPMLFSREDERPPVVVEAPAMPDAPPMPNVSVQPTEVPELQAEQLGSELTVQPAEEPQDTPATSGEPTSPPAVAQATQPAQPPAVPSQPTQRLDANNLPVSWSVQLASLSNRARADELQKTLRSQGYNAYVRTFDGMNRVFVGPVVERAEADRLRDQLGKQQKLKGFVVRFQPERG